MEIYTESIRDVNIGEIKVDPQTRIREPSLDFHIDPKYIALKNSINKFGLLHPITINTEYKLIAGFYRFNVAIELGWTKIKARIVNVPKIDERYLEFEENWNRKEFTDYEAYIGLARLKRDYEQANPETRRGRYIRTSDQNSKVHRDALMIKNIKSFIEEYHEGFGLQRRALFNKIRIGEAILHNKFDKHTLSLLKQGKISQSKLLQILKRKKLRKESKNISKTDPRPKKDQHLTDISDLNSEKIEKHASVNSMEMNDRPKIKFEKNRNNGITLENNKIADNIKDLFEIDLTKEEETKNEGISEEELAEKEELCIHCSKARVSPCPNCLIQFIMCTNDLKKGCFVLKKADSKKCEEFEY